MELKSKNLALHFININRYEDALLEVDELLSIKPEEGYYLYLRGYCLYYLDKNSEAAKFLKEAINKGYPEVNCHYMLGRVYQDMKKLQAAENSYKIVLNIDPNDSHTLVIYGYMLYTNSKKKKGIELIEKALELEPNDSFVLHYAFYYYLNNKNKNKEKLETILERYIKNCNSEVGSCIKIGYYEYGRRNYKLSAENFKKAYLLDPTNKAILKILMQSENMASTLYGPIRFFNKISENKFLYLLVLVILLISRLLFLVIFYMIFLRILAQYKRRRMGI